MSADEFEPRIVDKVERLLDLLNEMERYPALKGKLALHGGTAINLFMLKCAEALGRHRRLIHRVRLARRHDRRQAAHRRGHRKRSSRIGLCGRYTSRRARRAHLPPALSRRLGRRPREGRLHLHEPLSHPPARGTRDSREVGRQGAHVRRRRARRRQGESVLRPREGPRPLRRLQPERHLQVTRTRCRKGPISSRSTTPRSPRTS